eukprot:COSAG04_NODE_175_length_21521_cov_167.404071_5_plen_194_part_00
MSRDFFDVHFESFLRPFDVVLIALTRHFESFWRQILFAATVTNTNAGQGAEQDGDLFGRARLGFFGERETGGANPIHLTTQESFGCLAGLGMRIPASSFFEGCWTFSNRTLEHFDSNSEPRKPAFNFGTRTCLLSPQKSLPGNCRRQGINAAPFRRQKSDANRLGDGGGNRGDEFRGGGAGALGRHPQGGGPA